MNRLFVSLIRHEYFADVRMLHRVICGCLSAAISANYPLQHPQIRILPPANGLTLVGELLSERQRPWCMGLCQEPRNILNVCRLMVALPMQLMAGLHTHTHTHTQSQWIYGWCLATMTAHWSDDHFGTHNKCLAVRPAPGCHTTDLFDIRGSFQPNASHITHIMQGACGKFSTAHTMYVMQATQHLM